MIYTKILNILNKKVATAFISEKKLIMNENSPNIIVSLTSFPPRMKEIHKTIYSMLNQKVLPNKIVLWLNAEQFHNIEFSDEIKHLQKVGLEIKYVKTDYKSFNKLYYSLQEYPNDIIITIDDDQLYSKNFISELIAAHAKNPNCICSHVVHMAKVENNAILPYSKWKFWANIWHSVNEPKLRYLAQGVSGVLYKSSFFNNEFFNSKIFMKYLPKADDLWFWGMAVYNNTKTVSVKHLKRYHPIYSGASPDALSKTNCSKTGFNNDAQLAGLLQCYPKITSNIIDELRYEQK